MENEDMKKTLWAIGFVSVLIFGGVVVLSGTSQATNPFFSFCVKTYPAGGNAKPFEFALPRANQKCQSSWKFYSEYSPAGVIADLNGVSKGMFQNGLALGNYQTSIFDDSQPCQPSQPGCHP